MKAKKMIKKILIILISLSILAVLLAPRIREAYNKIRFKAAYHKVWEELREMSNYEQAEQDFQQLYLMKGGPSNKYQLHTEVCRFTQICQDNEDGNYRDAKTAADRLDADILMLTEAEQKYVENKLQEVQDNYSAHKQEYDEEDRLAEEKRRQEYEDKVRNGVPFIGMEEYRIDQTSLGLHYGEVRHNTELISGKFYTANLYDFMSDGKFVFTARCVQGRVTDVWDSRDNPNGDVIAENAHKSSNKSSEKKSESKKEVDPADHDMDAYYDDYKDEFENEEDAWDDFEDNPEYWDEY